MFLLYFLIKFSLYFLINLLLLYAYLHICKTLVILCYFTFIISILCYFTFMLFYLHNYYTNIILNLIREVVSLEIIRVNAFSVHGN